jgi:superfamily II RNA helicase
MVKICDINIYPSENEEKYKEHFTKFNYPLHIFQKWAIEGIVEGQHVLACCPTGSGKSLPAEFSLDFFVLKGKKVIYCSPIKSLSNQKFDDFSKKYPHISIGIITGDIRCNPSASVLIMTTEILLNKLYQIKSGTKSSNNSTSFEMDIENDLGCVIFDEIHFITDPSRGQVWENSIMMLPKHIQMIGLSATLDNPEKFAGWLENKNTSNTEDKTDNKIVYLTSKKVRAVPLTHYSFITATNGVNKHIKDKAIQAEIRSLTDKTFVIQDANGVFNDLNFKNINKMLNLFDTNDIHVKRQHVLNKVSEFLVENEMLPAICYVFSRKQLEVCAHDITTNLLEFDSKIPYTIDRECEQIIRKLPNYKEYLNLPEYLELVCMLRKGVAIHHSGMMPVLREIVEILFAKGYIKMLFATESVAIGLNLPCKTCIFTDIYKHDGSNMRLLQAHEYQQASGRSGRLGLDSVGHVIHLNNLFRPVETVNYKKMMNGQPQTLVSKFKFSFNLLLNMIQIGEQDFGKFAKRSMIQENIMSQLTGLNTSLIKLEKEKENNKNINLAIPKEIVEEYIELQEKQKFAANKKRKEIDRQIQTILETYKNIETDKSKLLDLIKKENEIEEIKESIFYTEKYIDNNIQKILDFLEEEECISLVESLVKGNRESLVKGDCESLVKGDCESLVKGDCESLVKGDCESLVESLVESDNNSKYTLLEKGLIATELRETHSLVFADLILSKDLDQLSSKELCALFSCVTNITVSDEYKDNVPYSGNEKVDEIVRKVSQNYDYYESKESDMRINTGIDYNFHFDILEYVLEWTDCDCIEDCRQLLYRMEQEKQIFLGEFVKAILKINNVASEMEKVAEILGNIKFLSKLKEIPCLTLKFVVTNQSLYI